MDWRAVTDSIMQTCRDTFGEPVTYQSDASHPPYVISGIYEKETSFENLSGSAEYEGFQTTIDFRVSDLQFTPRRDDTIIINRTGEVYKISRFEYDGFAVYRCFLREFVE